MRHLSLFFVTALFLSAFLPADLSALTLSRNLSLGDTGDDVKELQILLNKDLDTAVVLAGPGSPGNETRYFGNATRNAVLRFQKKYEKDVLIPAGLSLPTGFVGPSTRAFIQSRFTTKEIVPQDILNSTEQVPSDIQSFFSKFFVRPIRLHALSLYQAKPGQEVTIVGEGFLPDGNTVHIGSYVIEGVKSSNGTRILFQVSPEIKEGKYNVWVSNRNGTTYSANFGDYFSVSSNPQQVPDIKKIDPEAIPFDDVGKTRFTLTLTMDSVPNDIQIKTSFGDVKNISKNGNTVSFYMSDADDFENLSRSASYLRNVKFPVYVYINVGLGWSVPKMASIEF